MKKRNWGKKPNECKVYDGIIEPCLKLKVLSTIVPKNCKLFRQLNTFFKGHNMIICMGFFVDCHGKDP